MTTATSQEGTVGDLQRLRRRLADLRQARDLLVKHEVELPDKIIDGIDALVDLIVIVELPCLLCDKPVKHGLMVDDPHAAMPRAAVCGACAWDGDDRRPPKII